ncbi:MAG: hypothetical protein HQL65_08125 [Magnetococcales bacterium]|nr:hypothetical protein [Magnetococcales bacterium]
MVRRILVKEGQKVAAHELLIELDPTDNTADVVRLEREWLEASTESMRLRVIGEAKKDPLENFHLPPELSQEIADRHFRLLARQWDEYQSRLKELDGQRKELVARVGTVGAEIKKLALLLPLVRERAHAKESLYKQGIAPRMDYLELAQKLVSTEEELTSKNREREEAKAAVVTLGLRIKQAEAQFYQTTWSQYLEADRKAASLEQELEKARFRHQRGQLRAPEAGTVHQLKVFTEGGVVAPTQELMWIVPGEPTHLTPGMNVSSEIATGKRRIIEYLISPVLKLRAESFRER